MNRNKMTVREVADALDYDVSTITKKVRELFPELMQNGKTTYLTEPQVTAVKLKLGKNSELALKPKTDLEKEKRMTLKELADITGASYQTVADYAHRAGWTKNGKKTLLNEAQVTAILEAMKRGNNNQHNLPSSLEGVETEKSRELRLAMLYKEAAGIEKELRLKAEKEREIAVKELSNERRDHNATKHLLADREIGLEHIQRIAEAGGLMTSDREDMLSLYRR